MAKRFEIKPRHQAWEVLHNQVAVGRCPGKREAIRVALTLGRMQLRLGDDTEIVLCDEAGAPRVWRRLRAGGETAAAVA